MNVGDYYGNIPTVSCAVSPIVVVGSRLGVPRT